MEYNLKIGGIGIHIICQDKVMIQESLAPFYIPGITNNWDVEIKFSQMPQFVVRPEEAMIGQDLLLEFYQQGDKLICVAKGGQKRPLATTVCEPGFRRLSCYMNTLHFPAMNTAGDLLRLIPMRMILQHYGVLFFHASQIALAGTGILFTAPSGTGKTTQAKLWRKHRGAQLICNDRTLVREGLTYGFPVDGSEPVASDAVNRLGALVVLGQSPTNRISKLKPSAALSMLMPQLVIDTWSEQARELALDQLLELIQRVPVYRLECTPDIRAVECLEAQLMADEVI